MNTTLNQLQRRYSRNYVTLDEFMSDYMPHITSQDHLLRTLKTHPVPLKISRLHRSQKAQRIIFLTDLANWLDGVEFATKVA